MLAPLSTRRMLQKIGFQSFEVGRIGREVFFFSVRVSRGVGVELRDKGYGRVYFLTARIKGAKRAGSDNRNATSNSLND